MSWISDIRNSMKIADDLERLRKEFPKLIDEMDLNLKLDLILDNSGLSIGAADNIREKMAREYRKWKLSR